MKEISVAIFLVCFGLTVGHSSYRRKIPNGNGVNHPCVGKGHWDAVGHMNGGYTVEKNQFGQDFSSGGHTWTVELCQKDSDGDGVSNGEELGDPQCRWRGRGDRPAMPAMGHPGFCEQNRTSCSSGVTHADCPNPHAAGQRPATPQRRLPTGANDHPQTFLSKNMGQGQSFGQQQTDFGFQSFGRNRGMSPGAQSQRLQPQQTGIGSDPVRSRSGSFDRRFSGIPQSRGQSFSSDLFNPGLTSFPSGSDGRFGSQGLSRDFDMTGSRFIGAQPFEASAGGSGTSFRGEMGGRTMISSPGMDRFSSSLDQRTIQGIGSSGTGHSFSSPMSQGEIERSVQSRMERERSRFGGMGPGTRGMAGMAPGFSPSGTSSGAFSRSGVMGTGGMGHMRSGGMGSGGLGPGILGPIGSGGIGSASGMRTMGSAGMGPGFSTGMTDSFSPFMTSGSSGFSGHSFSSSGAAMGGGPGMSGGMSIRGGPGMSRGTGLMMPPGYPRF